MEILAVRLARLIVYFPTDELNPGGLRMVDKFLPAFIAKYDFRNYPEKVNDFDEQKGVTFELGRWEDKVISQFVLYTNGILVDMTSSTSDALAMLKDALTWAAEGYGLRYRPDMLSRKAYLSEVLFRSDVTLTALHPALHKLSERLSDYITRQEGHPLSFEPASLSFGFDTLRSKAPIPPLRIERQTDVPFSEMKYYSAAPLPTEEHINFLEAFEAALRNESPIY